MFARIQFGKYRPRGKEYRFYPNLFKNFQNIIDFGSNQTLPTTFPLIFLSKRFIFYPIIKKLRCFITQPVKELPKNYTL